MKHFSLLLAALLLVPSLAEARFGKRSPPPPAPQEEKDGEKAEAEKAATPVHEASPARARPRPRTVVVYAPPPPPPHYHAVSPAVGVEHQAPRTQSRGLERFAMGASLQALHNGAGLSAHLLIDGEKAGFYGEYSGFALLADDGSRSVDAIHLFDAHVTFALAKSERARVRFHLGADVAAAPDATFVGPSAGLSASADVVGPLTFDAGVQLTPFPFTQLDARAGVGVALGPLHLFGGVRGTYLNDQGRLDDIAHDDFLVGPYAGLGLVF